MCSAPVMFGGGRAMTYAGLVLAMSAWPIRRSRQRSRHLISTLDQSKCFSIGRLSIWGDRSSLARRDGCPRLRIAPLGRERRGRVDELRGQGAELARRRGGIDSGKGERRSGRRCEILDGAEVGAPSTADVKGDEAGDVHRDPARL